MGSQKDLADNLKNIAHRINRQVTELSLELEELNPELEDIVCELLDISDEVQWELTQRQNEVDLLWGPKVPAFCLFCGKDFYLSHGHSCGSLKLRGAYVSTNASG
jgi:hypothetical protein